MIIVDLDGTLVGCNSFTEFVKFLFRRYPRERWRLIAIVLKRKLRLITHHTAKERIVKIAESVTDDAAINDFVEGLLKHVRPLLRSRLQTGERVILATAAPALYAYPLASALGITEVCATERGKGENNGERKLRSVERLGVIFAPDTTVITDHYADLPLLRRNQSGINILINPNSATIMHLQMAGIPFITEKMG
ncbi:MAG: haloacid dehalogenase-like hydrolase [Muribaculaceae bacterium]|nr:haloacid dehalogenase-like hydrolase [Muribaculaceae bacterium]